MRMRIGDTPKVTPSAPVDVATVELPARDAIVGLAPLSISERPPTLRPRALVQAAAHARKNAPLSEALLSLRLLCTHEPLSAEERLRVNAAFVMLDAGAPQLAPHLVQLQRLFPAQTANVNAFVDGALTGHGGTAGEFAGGLIPVLSQANALRDLPHALRDAATGGWIDGIGLGGAVAAAVPGLIFIHDTPFASRETLRAALELSPIAESGLQAAATAMTADGAALARKELKVLNVARTELLARLERLAHPTQGLRSRFEAVKRVLTTHAKPEDLIGALRDTVGVPVISSDSGYVFNHLEEVNNGMRSLANAIEHVCDEPASQHSKLMLDGLSEFKNRVKKFLEIK